MAWQLSRRQTIAALTVGWTLAPMAARAVLPAASRPLILSLEVFDVGGFDPIVRRDAAGNIVRHNLIFRTIATATERALAFLDEIEAVTLAELTLRWEPSAGPQSLTMYDARLLQYSYVALAQQGRGQNYDEFMVAIESTHGSLWRREAEQTLVADYRVTPQGGVQWTRYTK